MKNSVIPVAIIIMVMIVMLKARQSSLRRQEGQMNAYEKPQASKHPPARYFRGIDLKPPVP